MIYYYFKPQFVTKQVQSTYPLEVYSRPRGEEFLLEAIHTEDTHMRLAGIEKGGYYPYPPQLADATASWFIPALTGTRRRILDPCAEEGEIAGFLGRLLNCETWGCELSPSRVEKAATRLDKWRPRTSQVFKTCEVWDFSMLV